MPRTAVIIINWNGWKDTIECLESFTWPLPDTHFYILDNASKDDSMARLQAWLREKAISYRTIGPNNLDAQLAPTSGVRHIDPIPFELPQVFLVANTSNAGFAGGNNIILRHVVRTGYFDQAWLLNNDTLVNTESLPGLQSCLEADPARAFAGSVLLDYAQPNLIQCCSVKYYKWLGVSKLYLKNRPWKEITNRDAHTPHPTDYYQIGASLLVDIAKIRQIGLMDESYFMYSEEADWQIRAKKIGFDNALAWNSVIYHKGRVSTTGRRHLFFYHYNRSAIILTRKNFGRIAGMTATVALSGITLLRSKCKPRQTLYGIKGLFAGWRQTIAKT